MFDKENKRIRFGIVLLTLAALIGLSACGESRIARISIEPERTGALPGSTVSVKVRAFTTDGNPAENKQVSVSSPTKGVLLSAHNVTLDKEGEAELEVKLSTDAPENMIVFQSGDLIERINLKGTKVSRLEITPGESRFEAGKVVDFQARVLDELGFGYPVTVNWTLTGQHAELREDGKVLMREPGRGILVAQYQDITQGHPFDVVEGRVANLQISPEKADLKAGETVKFKAEATNAQGYPVAARVQWTVEGDVGSMAADGAFFARTAGTGTVQAELEGVSAEASVEVEHGPLASILIELDQKKLEAGQTIDLAAQGVDAFGNRFSIAPEWYVSEPIGSINPEKPAFTALHAGTGEIRAKMGNSLQAMSIEVVPTQLARLEMSPRKADLIAGEEARFEVSGFDRFGNRVRVEPRFSLRDPLGEISPTGVFSTRKAGSTIVEAHAGEIRTESTVAVKPAEMVRLSAQEKAPLEMTAGYSHNFEVSALDRFGNTVEASIRWRLRPELGSITDQGVFTPEKVGKGQVISSATQPRTGKTINLAIPFTVRPGETASIAVKPAEATTVAGKELTFSATAYDRFGNETEATIDWSLSEPTIGTISESGRLLPVKAESGKVLARVGNVTGAAEIEVEPARIAYMKIIPETISIKGGEKIDLKAVAEDRFGNVVDAEVRWTLSDNSLGTIDSDGVLVARREGTGNVIAAARDIVDLAAIEVGKGPVVAIRIEPETKTVQAGTNVAFNAVGYDAGGNPVEITPQWSVEGERGNIEEQGTLLTRQAGTVDVVAAYGEMRETASIRVTPGPPASVELSPGESATLTAGETLHLTFKVHDAYGNLIAEPTPRWEVENNLGFLSEEGTFHARKAGQGSVRLAAGGASAEIPIRVVPGSVARVVVQPSGIKMMAGEREEFSAAALDAFGNRVEAEPSWSVAEGLGVIDRNGVFQARRSGEGYISARMGDAAGIAPIGVRPGPVASIDIQPTRVSLQAGSKVNLEAVAQDSYGNAIPEDVAWSIEADSFIGEITPEGVLLARQTGDGEVIAALDDVYASSSVSVSPGALAGLVLTPRGSAAGNGGRDADAGPSRPSRISLTAGDQIELQAAGRDRFGNTLSVNPEFRVEPASLGAFREDGSFVAQGAGRGRLLASARGVNTSMPIEVKKGDLSTLAIELPVKPLEAGKSYKLSALGFDEGNNRVP
ncbi:MAG: hypothetical protein AAGU11_10450, partial [Syntrophobacteraceae bacterium]